MGAHVLAAGRGSHTVLRFTGIEGEPDAAVVVARLKGQYAAVGHLTSVLHGLKPLFNQCAAQPGPAHLDRRDGHAEIWYIDSVHAVLTNPETAALANDVGWYPVCDHASYGVSDPDLVSVLARHDVSGSTLDAWPQHGWPINADTIAWAATVVHPSQAEPWAEAGYTARTAGPFIRAGLYRPEGVHPWRAQGWSDQDIADWAFAGTPQEAVQWQATQLAPQTARAWKEWGHFFPEQVGLARACGVTVVKAQTLMNAVLACAVGRPVDFEDAATTVVDCLGLLVRDQGADLATVYAYLCAGIGPGEAVPRYVAGIDDAATLAMMGALRGNVRTWDEAVERTRYEMNPF